MVPLYGPEKPSFIFYYCLIEVEGIGQTELGTLVFGLHRNIKQQ